jgi:hypothetical protein
MLPERYLKPVPAPEMASGVVKAMGHSIEGRFVRESADLSTANTC